MERPGRWLYLESHSSSARGARIAIALRAYDRARPDAGERFPLDKVRSRFDKINPVILQGVLSIESLASEARIFPSAILRQGAACRAAIA